MEPMNRGSDPVTKHPHYELMNNMAVSIILKAYLQYMYKRIPDLSILQDSQLLAAELSTASACIQPIKYYIRLMLVLIFVVRTN